MVANIEKFLAKLLAEQSFTIDGRELFRATAIAGVMLVFAGSAQLAAIPLIAAGAPLWVIWATAFCVNLRFVVFSLHLRDYFMFMPRARRLWLGFFTGDVTYVLFTQRFPKPAQTATQRSEVSIIGEMLSTASRLATALPPHIKVVNTISR